MDTNNASTMAMSPADRIAAAKASVTLILSLCSFIFGLCPMKYANQWRAPGARRISRKPTVASLLLCFGAGVLLFTALIHMQPDVRQSVRLLQTSGQLPDTDHLGDLMFCAGFFAVFAIDETVNRARGRSRTPGTAAVEAAAVVRGPPKSFRCLIAVAALSFQEASVGLSFGMQSTDPKFGLLFTAVNKLILAFCVCQELAYSGARNASIVLCSAVFAAVTPVGVAIGMALYQCCTDAQADQSPGSVNVVVQGVAAGSLAFVVFLEVLPRHKRAGFTHLLSTIVGFCVMLWLQIAADYQQYD